MNWKIITLRSKSKSPTWSLCHELKYERIEKWLQCTTRKAFSLKLQGKRNRRTLKSKELVCFRKGVAGNGGGGGSTRLRALAPLNDGIWNHNDSHTHTHTKAISTLKIALLDNLIKSQTYTYVRACIQLINHEYLSYLCCFFVLFWTASRQITCLL